MTYRNRDLNILKKCLNSLLSQKNKNFEVILVDYGSIEVYKEKLNQIIKEYDIVTVIRCNTQEQLWCKSRAINIALKQCKTPYIFIGDVDMIYHPGFIDKLNDLKSDTQISYFQVGFLNESESKSDKAFNDYIINFKSSEEATGMTLFNTKALNSVNGYDEFYHGWGAEDTDVHERLKNIGYKVDFYSDTVLMLHQWHPKYYRNKNDIAPFHNSLEQINYEYLQFSKKYNKTKANNKFSWGTYNKSDYSALKKINTTYNLTNKKAELKAFINNVLLSEEGKVIEIIIKKHKAFKSLKETTKKLLRKKTISFIEMEDVNNLLLENIIMNLRNKAYQFQYNTIHQRIHLIIKL
nr:glycosyltransferase [Flavivirga sp. MEBiC07777]